MPPTLNVDDPEELKAGLVVRLLVKLLTVMLGPAPVKLIDVGRVTENVLLGLPVTVNPAALPAPNVLRITLVPVRTPEGLITTVPADVVGATVPKLRSAVLVNVIGAMMTTVALALTDAANAVEPNTHVAAKIVSLNIIYP